MTPKLHLWEVLGCVGFGDQFSPLYIAAPNATAALHAAWNVHGYGTVVAVVRKLPIDGFSAGLILLESKPPTQ